MQLLGVLALLVSASAQVTPLFKANFDDAVATAQLENKPLAVKFFVSWCGHCQTLAPIWEELAESLDSVVVTEVDCTEEVALCERFQVRGYPQIRVINDGKMFVSNGPRTFNDLSVWLESGFNAEKAEDIPNTEAGLAPSGRYCADNTFIYMYRAQTTVVFNPHSGNFNFRVDGDMHVAWCDGNLIGLPTGEDATMELGKTTDCLQTVINEKTDGKLPTFRYDNDADKVTVRVTGVLPMGDWLGGSVDLELTKENCEQWDRLKQEL
eukprot:CAMPEP_0205821478 /NCGR_PEP_ID=MMETSP0206-20130828/7909_1 /ASSEMBLY_ACC=CAM_ASM_000279 /TAXON_ID=36767 /ORGANISM="Euplotes focardii, Strain TN1" /LENGTH=265 /DNA_ID=CAMNT_0053116987 /DNA_START=29 /DNA_END=826 /DNA_ORIENTATION=-